MTTRGLALADGLVLPLRSVTEKFAWLGRTGSGKTYGAMKAAELMLEAGAQIGAIDPVGVWRALRVPAEKGGRAFDVVVFGGLYGDLPLEPTAGALIADVVADRGMSFVLDISQPAPPGQTPGQLHKAPGQLQKPTRPAPVRPSGQADNGEPITGPEQRILDGIAWLEACGIDAPEQGAVAWLAKYSGPDNGAYKNPRARLNQRGLVAYEPGDRIRLTDSGRARANAPDVPGTAAQLQAAVLERLPGPERKILEQLINAYPNGVDNDVLAQGAGYTDATNGAYKNPRARLRTLGFIDYKGGQVVARSVLFLEGVR